MSADAIVLLVGFIFSLFDIPKRQAPFKQRSEYQKVYIPFGTKLMLIIEGLFILIAPYIVLIDLFNLLGLKEYHYLSNLLGTIILVAAFMNIDKATKREQKINEMLEKHYSDDI